MTPSRRLSGSLAFLLCASSVVAASDVHLPSLISESGVSRPEGKGKGNTGGGGGGGGASSRLRGGGGGGDSVAAVQLDDADAPHDAAQNVHHDDGDEFQCNTEPHTDYGGPIAFVWVREKE